MRSLASPCLAEANAASGKVDGHGSSSVSDYDEGDRWPLGLRLGAWGG